LAKAEVPNLIKAAKELLVVVTPGGLLAFVMFLGFLVRHRSQAPAESAVAIVIAAGLAALLLAYCMLVFDGRYIYPVIPLILAVGVGLFGEDGGARMRWAKALSAGLIFLGLAGSLVYASSPFRTLDRDFQRSCYYAGAILREHGAAAVVSIGSGPYPEHGVGWEAGYKSAYFGGTRLVAVAPKLPEEGKVTPLLEDLAAASPDAIFVWGRPFDAQYRDLVRRLRASSVTSSEPLSDPLLGEVGTVVFTARTTPRSLP
jgi:hypothetical protein